LEKLEMNNLEKDLVIVKAGTNTLTTEVNGQEVLNQAVVNQIGQEVREISDEGTGVIVVTSAGITLGTINDGVRRADVKSDVELQRYAARGWRAIVNAWEDSIGEGRVTSALLTKQELHTKSTRDKALGAISCCLAFGDVFVVNENDIICDDEIKFGDNDTLAGELAAACALSGLFKSVRLVMLTDINGLRRDKDDANTLIEVVTDTEEIRRYAGGAKDVNSRGGMATKVAAAETAHQADGAHIADGSEHNAIRRALAGEIGTRFELD
jgi:glutamate 5-kinase